MARQSATTTSHPEQTTQLTLQIWHPQCWTLQTTAAVDAGLIAHGVYQHSGKVAARLTAYADTTDDIDDLVSEIRVSPHSIETRRINDYFNPHIESQSAGNATEQLLVEYKPGDSIHNAFISRGFVPEDEIRVHDGYEYWTVLISAERESIHDRLDEIRDEEEAKIKVTGLKSSATESKYSNNSSKLSERQREVFELAQLRNYYSWPRETSVGELAEDLNISDTTLLEHLRKAEAKILGRDH